MPTEIYLCRHPNVPHLVAANTEDLEVIKKMKHGERYRAKVTLPRNVKFHRKFFALLNLVFESLPDSRIVNEETGLVVPIKTIESLLWHIKMQMGHYEQKLTLGGVITYETKSISFAVMDENEFNDFYSRAMDVILIYFLVGADREELQEMVILNF